MTTELITIQKKLQKKLKPERYEHTIGVMYTAASLAMCHGEALDNALTGGLLHDCGKFCSVKEQIALCEKYQILLTDSDKKMPSLIHAKLGAYLAEHEYGISDKDILDAITYHTTGRPGMTLLEKIIYISDYIEPNRKEIPFLGQVRYAAFSDINEAVALSAKSTLSFLEKTGREIDPMTIKTYQYYRKED